MSKTTKIVAALGIVAGLGVAALPAFTYAEQTPASVYGDVEVQVEVQPAIAMTIQSNNDSGTVHEGAFVPAAVGTEDDPSQLGLYEIGGTNTHLFILTDNTQPEDGKTYYELIGTAQNEYHSVNNYGPEGLVAGAYIDAYVVPTAENRFTGISSAYLSLLPGQKVEGDRSNPSATNPNNFGSTINVFTNNDSGFALSVSDTDAVTDLTHVDHLGGTGYYIPAQEGALTAGTAGWNYDTTVAAGGTTAARTAKAIENTPVTIDTFGSKTSGGRETVVDYNVATANDQATGIYTDMIVYTATTNN